MKRELSDHICPICGSIFRRIKPKSNAIYCSDPCRLISRRESDRKARARYRERMAQVKISPDEKKMLPCLCCGQEWLTTKDIRICPACKSGDGRRHILTNYRILGQREAI